MKNCERGGCADKARSICVTCPSWIPSRGSRYYSCRRYLEKQEPCAQPENACASFGETGVPCEHYLPPGDVGRPNESGIDWTDPDARRDYMRIYMRQRRHDG